MFKIRFSYDTQSLQSYIRHPNLFAEISTPDSSNNFIKGLERINGKIVGSIIILELILQHTYLMEMRLIGLFYSKTIDDLKL